MNIEKTIKYCVVQGSKNILLHNVNRTKFDKNCLMIYITRPFVDKKKKVNHPNYYQAIMISEIFTRLGFNVDVIYSEFTRKIDVKKYDVVLGMGSGYTRIFSKCREDCIKIYLATGTCFTVANYEELNRWIQLFKKGKGFIGTDRLEKIYEPIKTIHSLCTSDAIFSVGETDWVLKSFKMLNTRVYPIGTMPIINPYVSHVDRKYGTSRNGVLFLGGNGCIHKGLDIIVDVFSKRTDLTLYICGNVEKEFKDVYRTELDSENIRMMGFVDTTSKAFAEICSNCCFAIHMSCSEGCCTSVLTAMAAGLIPIVTEREGININDTMGFMLNEGTEKEIGKCLDEIKMMKVSEIEAMSYNVLKKIKENYSYQACEQKIENYLKEVLK